MQYKPDVKLTLVCTREGDTLKATWNGLPVDVSAIAADAPGPGAFEAECRYAGPGEIVAERWIGVARSRHLEPGFAAWAEARKALERGDPGAAAEVLRAAGVLPFEGELLRMQLGGTVDERQIWLMNFATRPNVKHREVARLAESARLPGDVLLETIGADLERSEYWSVAFETFGELPLGEAPDFWVRGQLETLLEELAKPCGYACEGMDPLDDVVWEELVTKNLATLREAELRDPGVDLGPDPEARVRTWSAEERRREQRRGTRRREKQQAALRRLEEHHGRPVPDRLSAVWTPKSVRGLGVSLFPLESYFTGPYAAFERLEYFEIFEPRYLWFGAPAGNDGPPFYALDLETKGPSVVRLAHPDEALVYEPVADSLDAWDSFPKP